MSVADYTVFGEIVTGSKILVAEYPSKPGGCGIWYKLPNGNKQTAFPKAELEAFFRSQNLDIEIQVNDGTELDRQLIWTDEGFTIPFSHMFVIPGAGGEDSEGYWIDECFKFASIEGTLTLCSQFTFLS